MATTTSDIVELRVDELKLKELESTFAGFPAKVTAVIMRAMTRAGAKMRTETIADSSRLLSVKKSIIKTHVFLDKATRKNLRVKVRAGLAGFPWSKFRPKQTESGVTLRGGPKGDMPHAFLADIRGTDRVFVRGHKPQDWYAGAPRLPIRIVRTASPASVIRKAQSAPRILQAGAEVYEKRLSAETELILQGKRSG